MSKFEVTYTPPRKNEGRRDELKEPTEVILGPFTPKAVVTFMDVPIGKTARRILTITSRYQSETTVQVYKAPPGRLNLTLEWETKELPKDNTIEMELVWKPLEAGVVNDIIVFSDDNGNKKEVKLIMKSIDLKKTTAVRRPVMAQSLNKKLKASPKRQVVSKAVLQQKTMLYNSVVKKSSVTVSKTTILGAKKSKPLTENNLNVKKIQSIDRENYGKENENPVTPQNSTDLFADIKFSAGTEKIPKESSCLEYLASLPTPKAETSMIKLPAENLEAKKLVLSPSEPTTSGNHSVFMTPCGKTMTGGEISMLADFATPKPNNKTVTIRVNDVSHHEEEAFTDAYDKIKWETDPSPTLERLSSETYVKFPISPCPSDLADDHDAAPIDKTRTMTPPMQMCGLSIIAEETEVEYSKSAMIRSETFQVQKSNETHTAEDAFLTPINRQIVSISTKEIFKPSPSKAWQGSMPNLLDDKSKQQLKNIENNRYYFQNVKADETINQTCASEMFCASEIKAQSSRFNLHEISESRESLTDYMHDLRFQPSFSCQEFTVPVAPEKYETTPTKIKESKQNHHSSPQLHMTSSVLTFSPPKKSQVGDRKDGDFVVPTAGSRIKDWNSRKVRLSKINSSRAPLQLTLKKEKTEYQPVRPLFNPDSHLSIYINPDPFAPTIHIDPFLHQSMCLDDEQRLVDTQKTMKNWLNTLVAIPEDLESHKDKIDVAKVFQEVQHKKDVVTETKEAVVSKFYKSRLDVLRVAAYNLYRSEEVSKPLRELYAQIEKGHIQMRSDCDLSLQIGLQQEILDLLFCFNTLWLRIGLEAITNEAIPMKSNTDIYALAHFIIDKVFRDPSLKQAYMKRQIDEKTYKDKVKKHTLKRILCLIFLLDQAKNKRIIKQNPCLFIRSAPYKQTKDILINFSCKMLGRMGDITKHLKRIGYVVTHKQSYLDEFDYSFNNLMVDLRDGVRLVKLMEIISLREDLTNQLRVPAISLLQKIHNIEVAYKALNEAGYQISGDISAKEIAQGHCEKTLSLLWQILYKFRAPKFNEAATVIQQAWKKAKLRFTIARRIEEKRLRRMNEAATTIQRAYRGYKVRKWFVLYQERVVSACVIIQKYVRRHQAMKHYKLEKLKRSQEYCAVKIQSLFRMRVIRSEFLAKRKAVLVLQKQFRSYLRTKREQEYYQTLKRTTIMVQRLFRANSAMKIQKSSYHHQRNLIIKVQQKFRATREMKAQKAQYQNLKSSAIKIQRKLRATLQSRQDRATFLYMKVAATVIQERFRATLQMRKERAAYLQTRNAVIVLQNRFRAFQKMKQERLNFILLKLAAESLQARYRALIKMRKQRAEFLELKQAAIVIQQRLRANNLMKTTRGDFLKQKASAIIIQTRFRSTVLCKKQHEDYLKLKSAAMTLQRRYRALKAMKASRESYQSLQKASICIQRRFKAQIAMKHERSQYLKIKKAVTIIQIRFRSFLLMREEHKRFLLLKSAAITIQTRFRAFIKTRDQKLSYDKLKQSVMAVQRRYRGKLLMKQQRKAFLELRKSAIVIQNRYKAQRAMKKARFEFLQLQKASVIIQRRFRARISMKTETKNFTELKTATVTVQKRFRALLMMRKERKEYVQLKKTTILIQQFFRAHLAMKAQRHQFLVLKQTVITIQTRFRANLLMREERKRFLLMKQTTILIQRRFRANQIMKEQRESYVKSRAAIIRLQERFRCLLVMKKQRQEFLELKKHVLVIQQRFRAQLAMKAQRRQYLQLRSAAVLVQNQRRALIAMRQERSHFLKLSNATLVCQRRFRETLKMRKALTEFQKARKSSIVIQRFYRGYRLMKQQRTEFTQLRSAALVIQTRFRAQQKAAEQRAVYLLLKAFTVKLQAYCRGYLSREAYKKMMSPEMLELRRQIKASKVIQAAWRGYRVRKTNTKEIVEIRKRVITSRRNRRYNQSVKYTLSQAVKVLKGKFNVYAAIGVLKRLERLSRIYPAVLVPHAAFVVGFCYGLMAQSIRSEPDKQLIELCAQVVLNLARYGPTKEFAFLESGLTTISQMLLRWCDKECGIFITLCTLIWLLGHCTEKRERIRKFMVTQEAIFMLRETKKLTIRKENMRRTVSKPFGCHLTQVPTSVDPRALPTLDPDYGIIRGRPYVFYSPSFALDTIFEMFNIGI